MDAELTPLLQRRLLALARTTIAEGLHSGAPLQPDADTGPLAQPAACFVTLRSDRGALRGCIGELEPRRPLAAAVAHNAFSAAFRDPRFSPLDAGELPALRIEISVLGTMEPLAAADETQLCEMLQPHRDGLVLICGAQRATFLPAVWKQLDSPARFVTALKQKAGLGATYWSHTLQFQRYHTLCFADHG